MNAAGMDSGVGSGRNLSDRSYSNVDHSNNGRFYLESKHEKAINDRQTIELLDELLYSMKSSHSNFVANS